MSAGQLESDELREKNQLFARCAQGKRWADRDCLDLVLRDPNFARKALSHVNAYCEERGGIRTISYCETRDWCAENFETQPACRTVDPESGEEQPLFASKCSPEDRELNQTLRTPLCNCFSDLLLAKVVSENPSFLALEQTVVPRAQCLLPSCLSGRSSENFSSDPEERRRAARGGEDANFVFVDPQQPLTSEYNSSLLTLSGRTRVFGAAARALGGDRDAMLRSVARTSGMSESAVERALRDASGLDSYLLVQLGRQGEGAASLCSEGCFSSFSFRATNSDLGQFALRSACCYAGQISVPFGNSGGGFVDSRSSFVSAGLVPPTCLDDEESGLRRPDDLLSLLAKGKSESFDHGVEAARGAFQREVEDNARSNRFNAYLYTTAALLAVVTAFVVAFSILVARKRARRDSGEEKGVST